MASTVFTDYVTPIVSTWLNDVNTATYKGTAGQLWVSSGANAIAAWTAPATVVNAVLTTPGPIGSVTPNTVTATTSTSTTTHAGTLDFSSCSTLAASSGSSLIGFLQGGAGAITLDLQTRGRFNVYPQDFMSTAQLADVSGFVGVVDVTSAFTAAMTRLSALGGGNLIVPAGAYRFKQQSIVTGGSNPTILVPDNIQIIADRYAFFLSEVGPAGAWGMGTALFVNSKQLTGGNKNITIVGGNYKVAAPAVTLTATTNGTTTVTVNTTTGLQVGMGVAGTDMPTGANTPVIVTINAGVSIVLSTAATGSHVGVTLLAGWSGGGFVSMVNVDGFQMGGGMNLFDVEGGHAVAPSTWFGMRSILSVQNFIIDQVRFGYQTKVSAVAADYVGEDGIHCYGGTQRGSISNIVGTSGDDFLALDIETSIYGTAGFDLDISDISISNLVGKSQDAQMLRMLVGSGTTVGVMKRVSATGISGKAVALGTTANSGFIIQDLSAAGAGRSAINNFNLTDVNIDCSSTATSAAGASITNATDWTIKNVTLTATGTYSIGMSGVLRGTIENPNFTVANRTASTAAIFSASGCSDIVVRGGYISNCTGAGISHQGCTRGEVAGVVMNANVGNGVALAGASSHFRIHHNHFTNMSGACCQEYNTANYNVFDANDVSQSTTNGTFTLLGANSYIVPGNIGYALTPGGITVTASPFTYTAGPTPETVCVQGGTVSQIVVGGAQMYVSTDKTVTLSPHQSMVVTYTGVPNMAKIQAT